MTPAEQPEDDEERQVCCSGCLQIFPESQIHVIPCFNDSAEGYVTTFRCQQCWIPSIEETRTRLAGTENDDEIFSAAAFFQRRGMYIHEYLRGDPAAAVRKCVLTFVDMLRSKDLRIPIGRDIPLKTDIPRE